MVSLLSEILYTNIESVHDLQHKLLLLKENFKNSGDKHIRDFVQKQVLLNLFLGICEDCKKMAALPQGAFVACKLRQQYRDKDFMVSRLKTGGDKNEKIYNGNKKLMEYSPVKYNEKLMNSIWGFYNRYSPHNIKSNEMVSDDYSYKQQQQSAVASQAVAHNIAMAVTTGKEWSFMKKN